MTEPRDILCWGHSQSSNPTLYSAQDTPTNPTQPPEQPQSTSRGRRGEAAVPWPGTKLFRPLGILQRSPSWRNLAGRENPRAGRIITFLIKPFQNI